MTTFSPSTVGSVATRMSSMRPAAAALSEMRPSCGLRRSAMSSFASTFRRVVTPGAIRFGIRCTSWSTPSTRKRTTSASSCGSKWTSEAPSSAAWKMIELTSRTSGASETPSSASRSSASSSRSSSSSSTSSSDGAGAEGLGRAGHAAQLGEDVVARGDAELERVAGREPELVDRRARCPGRRPRRGARRPRARTASRRRARATCSGISSAASLATPVSAQVDERQPGGGRRASARRPRGGATPSSTSACGERAAGRPGRGRARAGRAATRPVAAIRSTTSSAVVVDAECPSERCGAGGVGLLPVVPAVRRFGGRSMSISLVRVIGSGAGTAA